MHGWNLTNLSYVCHHIFLDIAQIGPFFQGPVRGKTLIMIRLGSSWYNCMYWSRFETMSSYKSSAISHLVIIRLACTKANSSSNFVTHPPSLWRSFVVLCTNTVWAVTPCGAVKSALRLHPSKDKKGTANTLALPHGSGAISEACFFVVRITWSR